MDDRAYWVAFNRVSGIGPARITALLEACDSLEAAWRAPIQQLRAAGIDRRTIERLLDARRTLDVEKEWQRVAGAGVQALTWEDAGYPEALRTIDAAPPVLYVAGALYPEDEPAVAIVGTRHASAYGREVAHTLATALARHGVTVVSGLALGIDTCAHRAALDAGGRTIAVLGSGVDQIYPQQNRELARAIMRSGAVISDYALGVRPEAGNFPPRNRIISGLSRAVIIVEAGKRSGALITASFAADQSRELYAVPGSILHPGSVGCNQLIQQGAAPLLSVEELLDQLNLERERDARHVRQTVPPDPQEAEVLALLSTEPRHVDELTRLAALPPGQVTSLLTIMELKGMVRQAAPLSYVRA